jgi:hypothetical protein
VTYDSQIEVDSSFVQIFVQPPVDYDSRIAASASAQYSAPTVSYDSRIATSGSQQLPCDPLWANVRSLIPLSANFADIINGATTPSAADAPAINPTALNAFGVAGVAEFNGSGQIYTTVPAATLAGDFTIEFFVRPTAILASGGSIPGYLSATILDVRPASIASEPFAMILRPNGVIDFGWLKGAAGSSEYSTAPGAYTLGVYNFFQIVRQGTNFAIYNNGNQVFADTVAAGTFQANANWCIGGFRPANTFDFKGLIGYMHSFRVTAGIRPIGMPASDFPVIPC